MPSYPFERSDGEIVERFYWMGEAPEIGSVRPDPETPGMTIRRLPSETRRSIVADYAHVASSVPRVHDPRQVAARRRYEARIATSPEEREACLKSAEEWESSKPLWNKTTANGKPIITSKKEMQEFSARTGGRYGWGVD